MEMLFYFVSYDIREWLAGGRYRLLFFFFPTVSHGLQTDRWIDKHILVVVVVYVVVVVVV